jgi:hypothetical protein
VPAVSRPLKTTACASQIRGPEHRILGFTSNRVPPHKERSNPLSGGAKIIRRARLFLISMHRPSRDTSWRWKNFKDGNCYPEAVTHAYCPISIPFHRHILQNDRPGRVAMSDPGHGLWLWLELPGSHRCYIYGSASKLPHHLPHHEPEKCTRNCSSG